MKLASIPTVFLSYAHFASSAARSPTRRISPPERLKKATEATIAEILERLNSRRDRTYPRVVKRARHNSYRVKRATDIGTKHDGPPTVELRRIA
jgi:hypothetical protein